MVTKEQVQAYFIVRRKHGKGFANYAYPDVMWYLWDKRLNLQWRLVWKAV